MSRPNVLIVGGLTSVSRQFAQELARPGGPPLFDRLRIVDKYVVNPPTTYVGPEFPRLVARPDVEYSQVNLTIPERLAAVFQPPENGRPWDLVFDFLGELSYDATERSQILQTYRASVNCAIEAARRGTVKAYVRLTFGFYECSSDVLHDEKEVMEPDGIRGVWWHETLRALAGIPNLPLVVIRAAIPYGPYCNYGMIQRMLVGEVYRYKQRQMRYLWSPHLRINTVHTTDIANACWMAAMWMARVGRNAANAQAGVPFHFANNPETIPPGLPAMLAPNQSPVAPLFNLVDDSDSTQMSTGQAFAEIYGIDIDFIELGEEEDAEELAGEINEWHGTVWYQLCGLNNPPIEYPPLQTYVDPHDLTDQASSWDGSKIKNIIGYRLKIPRFTAAEARRIIDLFKAEGVFPVVQGVDPDSNGNDDADEDDYEEGD